MTPAGIGGERAAVEQAQWSTPQGARRLLVEDLSVLDRHVNSSRPSRFAAVARSVHSQNGEDGIIEHLVGQLGISAGTFVEIGAADGHENCTRHLAERGWRGAWFEADPELVERARTLSVADRVEIRDVFVEPDNVVDLLAEAGVRTDVDVLVIDIDGNDYWVLEQILEGGYRPKLLVAEYSGAHRWDWVSPYRPGRSWDRSWDFGASLEAQRRLVTSYGYELVGCDPTGVNAFFVRSDLAGGLDLPDAGDDLYVPPTHRPATLGHPRSSPLVDPARLSRLPASELAKIDLLDPMVVGSTERHPAERLYVVVDVRNRTDGLLATDGPEPVYLAYRLMRLDGPTPVLPEPVRSPLASVVEPGEVRPSGIEVALPPVTGEYLIVPTVVQEFVAWRTAKPHEGVIVSLVDPEHDGEVGDG